jgi:mannose PTS system EIID component
MSEKINNSILLRVAMRAHFMMSAWNFQRMLNLGFLYSLSPAFKVLCKTPEKQRSFLERHVIFFNTHPYFASYILGMVIKKEEQMANSTETSEQEQSIESLKRMFMGPLGALGDAFFWGTLRPFFGLTAIVITILTYSWPKLFWVAPVTFLLLYNIFHEYIRFTGVFLGYHKAEQTIQYIQKLNLQKAMNWIQNLGILFAGILIGLFVFLNPISKLSNNNPAIFTGIFPLMILGIMTGLFYIGLQKKYTTTKLFFIALAILWIMDIIRRGL